jgi:hypothetical protein
MFFLVNDEKEFSNSMSLSDLTVWRTGQVVMPTEVAEKQVKSDRLPGGAWPVRRFLKQGKEKLDTFLLNGC